MPREPPVSLLLSGDYRVSHMKYLPKRNLIGSISSVPGLFTLKKEGNILENIIPYFTYIFLSTIQLIDDY